jgi:ankyrin repeat protein
VLHIAALKGHAAMVEQLISAGAKVNAHNREGALEDEV